MRSDKSAGWPRSRRLAAVYALILVAVLLAPFNFDPPIARNGAHWIEPAGIQFAGPGIVRSPSPPARLAADLTTGRGLTVEVWAAARDARQYGPARIVSYSLDTSSRNFSLAQEGRALIMRLRTTRTDPSGVHPHVRLRRVFDANGLKHIAVTYDFARQRVYVDGERRLDTPVPGGDFSNWDTGHYLVLGNEVTGDRHWLGKLLLVAVYDRALSAREIARHFAAGLGADQGVGSLRRDAIALFEFAGGKGEQVSDVSGGTAPALNLRMPAHFNEVPKAFMGWPHRSYSSPVGQAMELIGNILLFMPLGLFLHAALVGRGYRSWTSAAIVLAVGALAAFAFESAQYFLPIRVSSLRDVLANTLGAALGAALYQSTLPRRERHEVKT